jgi:hypothetical protein
MRETDLAAERVGREERLGLFALQRPVVVARPACEAGSVGEESDPAAPFECALERRKVLDDRDVPPKSAGVQGLQIGKEAFGKFHEQLNRGAPEDPASPRGKREAETKFDSFRVEQEGTPIEDLLPMGNDPRRGALSPARGFAFEPGPRDPAEEVAERDEAGALRVDEPRLPRGSRLGLGELGKRQP